MKLSGGSEQRVRRQTPRVHNDSKFIYFCGVPCSSVWLVLIIYKPRKEPSVTHRSLKSRRDLLKILGNVRTLRQYSLVNFSRSKTTHVGERNKTPLSFYYIGLSCLIVHLFYLPHNRIIKLWERSVEPGIYVSTI